VTSSDLPGSKHSSVSTTTTPIQRKGVANWVPPAKVSQLKDNAPLVRGAGSSPTIRVGLSRRAPIKPLHTLQSPLRTKK
jgi:hypothetical protein